MNRFPFLAAFLALGCAAIIAQVIRPDGVVKRTEQHRVDLSQCDTVRITLPLHALNVSSGKVEVYWFKKYADIDPLEVTCEVQSK